MRKMLSLTVFCILGFMAVKAQYSIKVVIDALPPKHPDDAMYFMGDFNGWNPNDPNTQFTRDVSGKYTFVSTNIPANAYEVKITRGSKTTVECAGDGKEIPNRRIVITGDTTIHVTVAGWLDDFARSGANPGL